MYVCMYVSLSVCAGVEREPALQRKHRSQTSSTKSQIFLPVDPSTSTGTAGPSTTTIRPPSSTSLPASYDGVRSTIPGQSTVAVHPSPSTSQPAAGSRSHDHHNEYMLLGDQSKFASNVIYHVRPRTSDLVRVLCRQL